MKAPCLPGWIGCCSVLLVTTTALAVQDGDIESAEPQEPSAGGEETRPSLELSIEEAIHLALDNNIDLELSQIQTEVARFDALGSWGEFDWLFDADLSYSDSEFPTGEDPSLTLSRTVFSNLQRRGSVDFTKPTTTGGSFVASFQSVLDHRKTQQGDVEQRFKEETTSILSLSYVQPLLRGAWSRYATVNQQEAEILYEQQQEAERNARQDLIVSVRNSYWDLVAAKEQLGVARNALVLGEQQLDQNERRLEAGVGTEVDVLQARSDVAVRTEGLLQTETAFYQAMDDLKRIVFASRDENIWETPIEPVTKLPETVSTEGVVSWTEAYETALEFRSDLRQSRYDIDTARVRHTRTLSNRLAEFDLSLTASSGSVGFNYAEVRDEAFDYDFPTYTALLTYSIPIGNRTADYAERAARAEVRSALLEYDNLETAITSEVRKAVRDVFYRAEAVRAAEESLRLEQRQLSAEEARYKEGLTTTFQVLEFQQDLILQMSVERRARVEFMKAMVALEAAQGLVGERQP